jgi:hypothetical protein
MNPRMFYIMGRAHCGSTFLDIMLGNVSDVVSVGEVLPGLNRGRTGMCSCGVAVGDCPRWVAVAERYAAVSQGRDLFNDGAWLYQESDVRKLPQAVCSGRRHGRERFRDYANRQRYLTEAIGQVLGPASAVLDSTKEFSRALMLLKMQPEARVIHLHRSPVTTLASRHYRVRVSGFGFMKRVYYYRPDRDSGTIPPPGRRYAPEWTYPLVFLLAAAAWSVGMGVGLLIKAMHPTRVLNVRYEKLMADPTSTLARIGAFLQIDTSEVASMVLQRQPLPVEHVIGGNTQVRLNSAVVFEPNAANRRDLPTGLKFAALPFALPGYALRGLFARR